MRPVHGLIVLHGGDIVDVSILGLQSGNQTLGHRFLSSGEITIEKPTATPHKCSSKAKSSLRLLSAKPQFRRP